MSIVPTNINDQSEPPDYVSSTKAKKRKFPGPAGLIDNLHLPIENPPLSLSQIPCSQSMSKSRQWTEMISEDKFDEVRHKFTVKWLINMSRTHKESFTKSPFLAANITNVRSTLSQQKLDFCVTLKDETGQIEALITKDLVKLYTEDFIANSVIVIENFSVIYDREHNESVINIGKKNFVTIYSSADKYNELSSCRVNDLKNFDAKCALKFTSTTKQTQKSDLFQISDDENDLDLLLDSYVDSLESKRPLSEDLLAKEALEGLDATTFFEDDDF